MNFGTRACFCLDWPFCIDCGMITGFHIFAYRPRARGVRNRHVLVYVLRNSRRHPEKGATSGTIVIAYLQFGDWKRKDARINVGGVNKVALALAFQ